MRKVGLVAMLALAGCVSHEGIRPLRPLEIATAPYRELGTTALPGSLMYEGGCLLFRDDQSGALLMPVWPAGSSFNGSALLYHLPGKSDQWIAIAQEVLVYGHPVPWGVLAAGSYQPFEHQCGAYRPFFVSGVSPAN